MKGTPCDVPGDTHECFHPSSVRDRFPDDRLLAGLGAESYLGVPLVDNDGRTLGVLAALHDGPFGDRETAGQLLRIFALRAATELVRKRYEEGLRKNEARLKEAQGLAHIGSWEWDITTNELYWSDEIYRIFGIPVREFEGTYEAFLERVHPEDREVVEMAVKDALYEKAPYSIDHRVVHPDGTERIVHERARVDCDETGRPARMVGTVHDITERRRAQQAEADVREKEERIEKLEKELSNLERLTRQAGTSVTARVMGNKPLRESVPPLFDEVVCMYGEALDLALQERAYKVDNHITERLSAISDRLGLAKARPRDIIDIHTTALKNRTSGDHPPARAKAYLDEGRLLVLELMGLLASFYRNPGLGANQKDYQAE